MRFQFGRLILAVHFGEPVVSLEVHSGIATVQVIGGFNAAFHYREGLERRGTFAWQRRPGATTRYAHLLPV
jgi:hypothetical protein